MNVGPRDELRDQLRSLPAGSSDEPLDGWDGDGDVTPAPVPFPGRAFMTLAGFIVGVSVAVVGVIVGASALAHTIVDLVVVGWNAGGWR